MREAHAVSVAACKACGTYIRSVGRGQWGGVQGLSLSFAVSGLGTVQVDNVILVLLLTVHRTHRALYTIVQSHGLEDGLLDHIHARHGDTLKLSVVKVLWEGREL